MLTLKLCQYLNLDSNVKVLGGKTSGYRIKREEETSGENMFGGNVIQPRRGTQGNFPLPPRLYGPGHKRALNEGQIE